MPTVPNFAIPGVLPSGGIQPISPENGLQADNALQSAGAKVQAAGDKLVQTNMQLDQFQQQSAGLNANNDFMQKVAPLVSGPNGILAKQGQNAIDAYQPTVDRINELKTQASAGLSPYAKQLFDQTTNYMMRSTLNEVGSHVAQQTIVAHQSALLGTASLTMSKAAQNYNDPDALQTALATRIQAYGEIADEKGLTGPAKAAFILNGTSSVWKNVVMTAASYDPMYAEHLMDQAKQSGQLDGSTMVQLQHQVKSAVLPFATTQIATQIVGGTDNPPSDGIFSKMVYTESRGNQFGADGKPLISSAGAVGIAQVEPATGEATAKANGIPWDPVRFANDAAYNHHLGHLYFKSLQAQFPGNTTAAVAAYNAGPQTVRDAMAKAQQNGTTNWVQYVPTETQNYIADNIGPGATGAQPGAGMSPPEMMQNVQLLETEASKQAELQFPDQPDAGPMAANRVFQLVMQKNEAYEHAQRATTLNLADVVTTNKIDNVADLNKLGPQYAAQYNALGPQGQLSIQALMKHNTPGYGISWTPKAQTAFNSVIGLANTDPAAFLKINPTDPALVAVLPHSMISQISARQAAIQKGVLTGVSPSKVRELLEAQVPNLVSAGLNPRASPITHPKQYAAYQQFAGAYSQDVDAFYEQHDRMPNAQEAQAISNRLLIKGTLEGTGNWLSGPDSEPLFEAEAKGDLPKFEPVIPPAINAAINTAYMQKYGHPPDKQTAAQLYLESLSPSRQDTHNTAATLKALGLTPLVPLPPARKPPAIVAPPPVQQQPGALASAGNP